LRDAALGVTGTWLEPPITHPAPIEGHAEKIRARPGNLANGVERERLARLHDEHVGGRIRGGRVGSRLAILTEGSQDLRLNGSRELRDGRLRDPRRKRGIAAARLEPAHPVPIGDPGAIDEITPNRVFIRLSDRIARVGSIRVPASLRSRGRRRIPVRLAETAG
jgi:hypothetical protein